MRRWYWCRPTYPRGSCHSAAAVSADPSAEANHRSDVRDRIPRRWWLDGCIALDEKGFVKTGPDLSSDDLGKARWALSQPPYLLETSRPGIFAVGDVRAGNMKASRLPSAKDRSRSRSFIRCSPTAESTYTGSAFLSSRPVLVRALTKAWRF